MNGAPGRVVAFVAGSHGTEYASIVALSRLIAQIDPKILAGTVIVVPLLNVASFEQMTVHVNPVDRKGMNAGYPGNANGTQTERALAMVGRAGRKACSRDRRFARRCHTGRGFS